jgi:hypothetical protein
MIQLPIQRRIVADWTKERFFITSGGHGFFLFELEMKNLQKIQFSQPFLQN